jgi:hypothetical protein
MNFFITLWQSVLPFLFLPLVILAGGRAAWPLNPTIAGHQIDSVSHAADPPREATPTHQSTRQIVEGVEHFHWFIQRSPLQVGPWNLHVLTVDLTRPGIEVRVVQAQGPETVSEICKRVGALAGVNAQRQRTDAEDVRLLVTEGKIRSVSPSQAPELTTLGFYENKAWLDMIRVEEHQLVPSNPTRWFDWDKVESAVAVGPRLGFGGKVLLEPEREGYNADALSEFNSYRPRTAVGLQKNQLILVTVDGRQPDLSIGMTLEHIAGFLVSRQNALYAMALDGEESTTMVIDGLVVNSPAGRREQPVRSAICIFGPEERILE